MSKTKSIKSILRKKKMTLVIVCTIVYMIAVVTFAMTLFNQRSRTLEEMIEEAPPTPYTLTDWETEIILSGIPSGPEPKFMKGEEGLNLAYREFVPDGWNGKGPVLVYIPGSSSHSGRYSIVGYGLAKRGIFTRIIDTRGHGLSVCKSATDCSDPTFTPRIPVDDSNYYPGRIGDCLDADQISRDLNAHLEDLRKKWPKATFHLAGHSSGGGCISHFVEYVNKTLKKDLADVVDSIALVAPYNHYQAPNHIRETNDKYALVHDYALQKAISGDTHVYCVGFNHKFANETINAAMQDPLRVSYWTWNMVNGMAATSATMFWSYYNVPVMLIIGDKDVLFDINETRNQFEQAPEARAFVVLENHSHIGMAWSDESAAVLAQFFENPNSVQST
ncbi:MAG: alpha/beta hydrolase [Promethearchaeota archaeon]